MGCTDTTLNEARDDLNTAWSNFNAYRWARPGLWIKTAATVYGSVLGGPAGGGGGNVASELYLEGHGPDHFRNLLEDARKALDNATDEPERCEFWLSEFDRLIKATGVTSLPWLRLKRRY